MKKTTMGMLALMLTTMTACEKAVMDDGGYSGSGQVANAIKLACLAESRQKST